MKSRQEIKAYAKTAMKEQHGTAIVLPLSLMAIGIPLAVIGLIVTFGPLPEILSTIIFLAVIPVSVVLEINMNGEFIKIYNNEEASLNAIFSNLNVNFLRKFGGAWWMGLWVAIWSILFIIPGIIKGLSYSLTTYILADCPNVSARDALKLSMRMTHGYKLKIFVFGLSFFGWMLLSGFTFGILFIVFVGPYMHTSYAGLYVELRDNALRNGVVTAEELGMYSMDNNQIGNFN